jgi:hypothetical protein
MRIEELEKFLEIKTGYTDNPETCKPNSGFNMSGFDNSFAHNMEIIGRVKNYFEKKIESPNALTVIPTFWKGTGQIRVIHHYQGIEETIDASGQSTIEILVKMILICNRSIVEYDDNKYKLYSAKGTSHKLNISE